MHNKRLTLAILAGFLAWLALQPPSAPPVPPPSKPAAPQPAAKIPLLFFTQAGCAPCAALREKLAACDLGAFDLAEVVYPDQRFSEHGVSRTPTLIALMGSGSRRYANENLQEWLNSCLVTGFGPVRRPTPPRSSAIVEGGYNGPDGRRVQLEFPAEFWKENITSRGQGCCVFRSWGFSSHWQNVPALWGFPEWLRSKGLPGGGYSENVNERIAAICKERGARIPNYLNVESRDFALLKLILATGRMAMVDYTGADGVHYGGYIAHCVCIVYADDDYVAILDNNFPPNKLLWMPTAEFKKRWPGWLMCLLAPRPPAAPRN